MITSSTVVTSRLSASDVIEELTMLFSSSGNLLHGTWSTSPRERGERHSRSSYTEHGSTEMGVGLIPTESVRLVVGRFLHAERLVLTGRLLTPAKVVEVLDAVGPGLKRLRIGPVVLSPQMVDAFAVCIPELERLELVVTHVVPWDEDGVLPRYDAESEYAQDESQVTRFFEEMRRRQYAGICTWTCTVFV
ncbi:hypothetical protein BDZ89DRAFT_465338 [Hymenopellis radicata]|nr:hypothetical protein BDZ89DRAFT_465338 [Hymenopellis radicata]